MNKYETKLFEISNPEEAMKRAIYYCRCPKYCDFCSVKLTEYNFFIDGEIRGQSAWAHMCPKCFSSRGSGIGFGTGQLYMKQTSDSWLMSAGFPPTQIWGME